jgi:hypothetical protein
LGGGIGAVAMSEKQRLRRLAKLGALNFETAEKAQSRQRDLLRRLDTADIDPGYYVGLDACGPNDCGRMKCAEACWFGTRTRRMTEIPAVHQLFARAAGPVHVVRIVRGVWERPINSLNRVSIAAVKQLNRRALDRLYNSDVVAVGMFKISISLENSGPSWIPEIYEIVVGPSKEELYAAFHNSRSGNQGLIRVEPVKTLGDAISDVLRRDLEGWRGFEPKKSHRAEFYSWLVRLPVGERIIRYGCDRYFNKLTKRPRQRLTKLPKKRPYPHWLESHMYGNHPAVCDCRLCTAFQDPGRARKKGG